jgi:hypothetical protein
LRAVAVVVKLLQVAAAQVEFNTVLRLVLLLVQHIM